MARYLVSLRGIRPVEGIITVVAGSAQEAMEYAQRAVDRTVAEYVEWETDFESPVTQIEITYAEEVED